MHSAMMVLKQRRLPQLVIDVYLIADVAITNSDNNWSKRAPAGSDKI
jgi:hypothetical protein